MRTAIKAVVLCASLAFTAAVSAIDLVSTKGQVARLGPVLASTNWTLVMLWAHDCVPCERQKPMIEKFHTDTFKRGVKVVGVSTDATALRDKAEKIYRATRTSFDTYYFEGTNFKADFLAFTGQDFLGTPTYMVFDPDGILKVMHTGSVTRGMLDELFKPMLKERVFTPSVDILQ